MFVAKVEETKGGYMRILIVDDSKTKNEWIRDYLDTQNIQYDEVLYMNEAYLKIHENPTLYDGIILDMQFARMKGVSIDGRMGEKLIKRLKHGNINIPVLGNSIIEFPDSTEYPFLKGNTYGIPNLKVLNTFLEKL